MKFKMLHQERTPKAYPLIECDSFDKGMPMDVHEIVGLLFA